MQSQTTSFPVPLMVAISCMVLFVAACNPPSEMTATQTQLEPPIITSSPTIDSEPTMMPPSPSPEPTVQTLSPPLRCYYPSDAVITPDGGRIYVPCYATNNLVVVDTTSEQVVDSIDLSPVHELGMHVYDAEITPDGKKIYLGDDLMDIIAVIDTEENEISGVIDFEREGAINAISISPDGQLALVAFEGGNSIGIIDIPTDTVKGFFDVQEAEAFYLVEITSDGNIAYVVSHMHGGRVYILDMSEFKVLGTIDLDIEGDLHPQATMALSPDDRYLYLTSGFNAGGTEQPEVGVNRIIVIDLQEQRQVDAIEILGGPQRITLSADGRFGYVSTFSAGKVVFVDLVERAVLGEFDWGPLYVDQLDFKRYDLRQIVIHPDQARGYLVGWDGGILAGLDLKEMTVTGAIELNPIFGAEPVDILITSDGKKAYLPTWGRYPPNTQDAIVVINLQNNAIEKRIPMDDGPMRPSITADNRFLYVPTGSSTVAVIDTSNDELVRTIVPGPEAHFFTDSAILDAQNKIYVSYASQDGGGGIYVIDLDTESTISEIKVDSPVASLALASDGSHLFANRILDPEGLLIVETTADEIEGSIPPPEGTNHPEVGVFTAVTGVSPDGISVFWGTGPSFVNILDLNQYQVIRTIAIFDELLTGVPIAPSGVGFSPDGSYAYIPCLDAGYMVVWDHSMGELTSAIRVGVNPVAIAISPGGELAYVPNMLSEDISVIDLETLKVVETIWLGQ
jgi:YVTN family beta-propeller protein